MPSGAVCPPAWAGGWACRRPGLGGRSRQGWGRVTASVQGSHLQNAARPQGQHPLPLRRGPCGTVSALPSTPGSRHRAGLCPGLCAGSPIPGLGGGPQSRLCPAPLSPGPSLPLHSRPPRPLGVRGAGPQVQPGRSAGGRGSPGPARPVGGRPRVPRSSLAGQCGAGRLPRDVLPWGGQGSGAVGPLAVAVPPLAPGRGPETRRPAPRPPAGSVSQSWVSLHTDRLSTRGQSLVQHRNLRRVTFDHGAVPHSVVSRWLVEGPRSRRAVSG